MDELDAQPIVTLVEWPAAGLRLEDARRVARDTTTAFRRIPGLLEFRFFGDFESGTHYYLQVWRDRAAMDAYAASESMFRIREIAAPFVTGRPGRKVLVDYSEPAEPGPAQPPTTTDSP